MTITCASLYAELTAASFIFALFLVGKRFREVLFRICAVQRPITSRQLGGHVSTADSAQPKMFPDPFPLVGERDYGTRLVAG